MGRGSVAAAVAVAAAMVLVAGAGPAAACRRQLAMEYDLPLRISVGPGDGRAFGRALASAIGSDCARSMDIVFLLDESGSVGAPAWVNATKFVAAAADAFDVGINRTRMGVVKFSTSATVSLSLASTTDYCNFAARALALPYKGGSTNTPLGLTTATTELATNGRPKSMAYPKVMIVVTDGQSNMPCSPPCSTTKTIEAANAARKAGINVLILTVGAANLFNPGEVSGIAGGDAGLQFALASYKDILGTMINTISNVACKQPTIMDLVTVVNTTVVGNSSVYLAYMNVSGPLNLVANVSIGNVNLCFSYTNRNPSSAAGENDGCAVLDPATGNATKIITAYPSAASNYTVYVVCEGAGENETISQFAFGVLPCQMKSLKPSASASSLPQAGSTCYSCPADEVMLASSGPYAGMCAAQCLSEHQWAWPVGRRLCQDCASQCKTCGPAGSFQDCTTCSPASAAIPYLLLNTQNPAADPAYDWTPGSGTCVGSCPANLTLVPNPVNTTTLMCGTPIPSPSATPTSSISPGASISNTPTRSPSSSVTRSIPASPSITPSWTPSSSGTGTASLTATVTSSATPSETATASSSPSATATGSRTASVTGSNTASVTVTATSTASGTATATATKSATHTGTGTASATASGTASVTASATATASPTSSPTGTSTPSSTPLPLSNKCSSLGNCNTHGTCRENPDKKNSGLCFCDFPYAGDDCTTCVGGYFLNTTCTSCVPNVPGPCKSASSNACSPYASYTNEGVCGSGTKLCDGKSGKFKGEALCAACPGLIYAPDGQLAGCNAHGVCEPSGLCSCEPGWIGSDCGTEDPSFDPDPCAGVTCSGNGICVEDGSCVCNLGWVGDDCSESGRRRRRALEAGVEAEAGARRLPAAATTSTSFGWHATPWSRCSAYCADPDNAATAAGGVMNRTITCRPIIPATGVFVRDDMVAGWDPVTLTYTPPGRASSSTPGRQFILHPYVLVNEALCDATTRPVATTPCNTHFCIADGAPVIVSLNFGRWLSSARLESQSPSRAAWLDTIHAEVCALLGLTTTCDAVIPPHSVQVDLANGTNVVLQINPEASIADRHGAPPSARVLQSGVAAGARLAAEMANTLVEAAAEPGTRVTFGTWLRRIGGYASYSEYLAATSVAGSAGAVAGTATGAAVVASFTMTESNMIGVTPDVVFGTEAGFVSPRTAPPSSDGVSPAVIGGGVAAAAVVIGSVVGALVYRRMNTPRTGKSSRGRTPAHTPDWGINDRPRRVSVTAAGSRRALSVPTGGNKGDGEWGYSNPMAAAGMTPRTPPLSAHKSRVLAQVGDAMPDEGSAAGAGDGASAASKWARSRRASARLGFGPSVLAVPAAAEGKRGPAPAGSAAGPKPPASRSHSAAAARRMPFAPAPSVATGAPAAVLTGYMAAAPRAMVASLGSAGRTASGRNLLASSPTGRSGRALLTTSTGRSVRSLAVSTTAAEGGGSSRGLGVSPTHGGSSRGLGVEVPSPSPTSAARPKLAQASGMGSSRRVIDIAPGPSPRSGGPRRSPSPVPSSSTRRSSLMAVDMPARL